MNAVWVTVSLAALAVVLAAMNGCIAEKTLRSQEGTLRSQQGTERLQKLMNDRDVAYRQARARNARDFLIGGLRRISYYWENQEEKIGGKDDLLAELRPYEQELAWIPEGRWKAEILALFAEVGPLPSGRPQANLDRIRNVLEKLRSDRGSKLYAELEESIRGMGDQPQPVADAAHGGTVQRGASFSAVVASFFRRCRSR